MTSYTGFFSGTATVAGALTGLLFVALSVAPDRIRSTASVEHQAVAATAFTALIDALFVSLIGLQPGGGLRYGAVILGGIGLSSSCGMAARLWRARNSADLGHRWPYLLGFIIAVYTGQVISGLAVTGPAEAELTVTFVYIMFAIGIARSWELLGYRGGGPLDLLVQRVEGQAADQPGTPADPDTSPGPH